MALKIETESFIKKHQLSEQYQQLIDDYYLPLASDVAAHHSGAKTPLVLGINGAQGSGKSTLADFLVFAFQAHSNLNVIALSLDDFYHTRKTRQQLADNIHPLLSTRGVPGTHDTHLAINTIQALKDGHLPVSIPRFNKALDDRVPETTVIEHPVDIIILEGWCTGTTPQEAPALAQAINGLEAEQDPHGIWRQYVNQQLAGEYQQLFSLVDTWIMLKAPSFDCVYEWRLQQEEKLKANTKAALAEHVMSPEQVKQFVQLYQRITEHTLQTLPERVDYLYVLDAQRNIMDMTKPRSEHATQWLVFTDMDGSLLDHDTYSYEPAALTLVQLNAQQIPVMPITSKTQAELEQLRQDLNNRHPFIIENGAAVFIPKDYFAEQPADTVVQDDYWVKTFVKPRASWQALIAAVRADYLGQFLTFAEAGIAGIVEMTGLTEQAATQAAQRQYGEPVKWLGDDASKQGFIAALKSLGANILEGGRFIHVSGKSDKGVALNWLTAVYQSQAPDKQIKTVALGDSQNDIAMLEAADAAVLIRSPAHDLPTINRSTDLHVSSHTGPAGWAEGIQHFIDVK